nr:hypothetical protein [uncultured Flavobacterium sp.]
MKIIHTLLTFLSFSLFLSAQTKYDKFDQLILEADSLKIVGEYQHAYDKYANALRILIPDSSTPYFSMAECALKSGNIKKCKKSIIEGLTKGGAEYDYLIRYDGFKDIQMMSFYQAILKEYNHYRQQYFSRKENIDVFLEILALYEKDQLVRKTEDYFTNYSEEELTEARKQFVEAQEKGDKVKLEVYKKILFPNVEDKYSDLMVRVDDSNIKRLIEITKKYGWQPKAWLLLWHHRSSYQENNFVWNHFIPLINKEIEQGKISRTFWKPFEDEKNKIHQLMKANKTNL